MKIKDLIIEICIGLLAISAVGYTFYALSGNSDSSISTGVGFAGGFSTGFYMVYFHTKKQLEFEEAPNLENAVRVWRYIIVGVYIGILALALSFQFQFIQSPKWWHGYYFVIMIIWGNYKLKIDPVGYMMDAYLIDEDVAIKVKRVAGIVTVILGLGGLVCCLFLAEKPLIFVYATFIIFSGLIPYFYAKYLHKKKYA